MAKATNAEMLRLEHRTMVALKGKQANLTLRPHWTHLLVDEVSARLISQILTCTDTLRDDRQVRLQSQSFSSPSARSQLPQWSRITSKEECRKS
jgi:hypothetical protein